MSMLRIAMGAFTMIIEMTFTLIQFLTAIGIIVYPTESPHSGFAEMEFKR